MIINNGVINAITRSGFLCESGAHFIADGQFGSTGKGLLASFLSEYAHTTGKFLPSCTTTNAGPNSGHTFYFGSRKVVLRQLPSFPVWGALTGKSQTVHINAGAVIVPEILIQEIEKFLPADAGHQVMISKSAAWVNDETADQEENLIADIGSTGKGTGAAISNKILRKPLATIVSQWAKYNWPSNVHFSNVGLSDRLTPKLLVEISQGFSLGINQGFYPYTTSRECTVMQAMSDACIHPSQYRSTAMVVRTFPIRVAGNSGPGYPDQEELTWGQVGQEPELTTVTQKPRRIFSWSALQYEEALKANRPDLVMINFVNYLPKSELFRASWIMEKIVLPYRKIMGKDPVVLKGLGPLNSDVELY